MEEDIDWKKYNDYSNGSKEAFEYLYNKYKNKIIFFIFNMIKDYQKAEDIAQETFIYIIQNKIRDDISFKYNLFLVARSRALNYLSVEKRRGELIEEFIVSSEQKQEDLVDGIIQKESDKELLESIELLKDNYKNAVYLVDIEGLSYKETSEILGESLQNTKNKVYRGRKQLRKIIIKKGIMSMNKITKILIIIALIIVSTSGIIYSVMKINGGAKGKAKMVPSFSSSISTMDENKVWCGTFNLVWNDFMNDVIGHKIEFEDGPSEMANELNEQKFTIDELDEKSYFKIHGIENLDLKNKIIQGIKNKFNEESTILERCDFNSKESGYVLYAMLKKEFNFLEPFSTAMGSMEFKNSNTKVKCFGVDNTNNPVAGKNVEVLFYNSTEDFAIKLKTIEGEEVYLYKTPSDNNSFEEKYFEMISKKDNYKGNNSWEKNDYLRIPFISVKDEINYDELCGRYIKGKNKTYIKQALQTINFELNNVGGSVKSEALIEVTKSATFEIGRKFLFDDNFVLFLKEENKEKPYFALNVDNIDLLEVVDE
jgi:RNA polymerase sigma-70 factor (ECF subfamily)